MANRGEIASRVFRTCRRLGIETVAVHSDADAGAAVRRARPTSPYGCRATRRPTPTSVPTSSSTPRCEAGADAIHPGYGFLSENADFARAVIDAGLTWVGPAPESIEQMGSKVEAKKLMEAAGVPVLGNLAAETATEADLPLLVKASAGGGGRGMRIVRALADLPGEIEKAAGRGGVGVRRRDRLRRAVRRARPARRGAGRRRPPTACSCSASGTARSSAGTRRWSRRPRRRTCPTRPAPRCTTPPALPPTRSTTAAPAPSSSSTTPRPTGSSSWR